MGMWGLRNACVSAAAVALVGSAGATSAAAAPLDLLSSGAPAVTFGLSVVPAKPVQKPAATSSGGKAASVKSGTKPAAAPPAKPYVWLTGASNLPLRNEVDGTVRIDALFFPAQTTPPPQITTQSRPLAIGRKLTIRANGAGTLHLLATLTSDQEPSDLNGTLVVESRDLAGKLVGSLSLAVSGTVAIPADVVFEPSEVTLQVTRLQGTELTTTGDHLHVRLRGAGVDRLVATVGALAKSNTEAQPAATVLLGSSSGKQTLVELTGLTLIQPGLAEATITTQESVACVTGGTVECGHGPPSPGSYSGALTLTGSGDGPTLKITVNSRFWFLFPVLMVFAGWLLGVLVPLLSATAQTKRQLRQSVRDELERYLAVEPKVSTGAAWDLAGSLGDRSGWYDKHHAGTPGDTSVAAVWTNIHTARSAKDLAQADKAATDLITRVQAWIHAAPFADALDNLRTHAPEDRVRHVWSDTQVRKDTDALLYVVRDTSTPSADDAAGYAVRLRRQAAFHEEYARVWKQLAGVEGLVRDDERAADGDMWQRADLDGFDAQVANPAESTRTSEQWARLTIGLADIAAAVGTLITKHPVPPGRAEAPADAEAEVTADETPARVSPEEKAQVIMQLAERAKSPEQAAKVAGVNLEDAKRIQDDLPETTAAVAVSKKQTPAAVSRTKSVAQRLSLAQPGSAKSDAANGSVTHRLSKESVTRLLWAASDYALSFFIAVVTTIAYMIPLYTSTWGGWEDWLAAFGAGVIGTVGIKWAVLPAFRSKNGPALDDANPDTGN
jgi:hypothetical protein